MATKAQWLSFMKVACSTERDSEATKPTRLHLLYLVNLNAEPTVISKVNEGGQRKRQEDHRDRDENNKECLKKKKV